MARPPGKKSASSITCRTFAHNIAAGVSIEEASTIANISIFTAQRWLTRPDVCKWRDAQIALIGRESAKRMAKDTAKEIVKFNVTRDELFSEILALARSARDERVRHAAYVTICDRLGHLPLKSPEGETKEAAPDIFRAEWLQRPTETPQ